MSQARSQARRAAKRAPLPAVRVPIRAEDAHVCEDWRDMCDDCRTEFEAWKTAKGKP